MKMAAAAPKLVYLVTVPVAAWAFLRGQLAYLRERGFAVYVIASPGPLLEEVKEREDVSVVGVPMSRGVFSCRDAVALVRLWMFFRRLQPAVIHASTPKAALLGMVAAWLAGVPARVYGLWGLRLEGTRAPLRWLLWLAERLTCALAHRVVCASESLRRAAIACRIVREEKTIVIGDGSSNGVEADRFVPTPERRDEGRRIRQRLGLAPEAAVVGFVGRLVRDKGIEELVAAFGELRAQRANLRLLLVGPFEEGDPVSGEARRAIESDPAIAWTGFVKNPEAYYHAMDVLVLPTYREGFSNVTLEGACAELPVVTTTATGAVDAVVDGETGFLVPPRDALALAAALTKLLDNPEAARKMGKKGRERAERDFRPERIREGLYQEFCRLLCAKGIAPPAKGENQCGVGEVR